MILRTHAPLLFFSILMHKMGAEADRVKAELQRAIEEGKSPNVASKTAHLFLGTVDERVEFRPDILFAPEKVPTAATDLGVVVEDEMQEEEVEEEEREGENIDCQAETD